MPATPSPISIPGLGSHWTAFYQAAQNQKQKLANLTSAQPQGNLYDQYQNCIEVSGTNLNQIVIIGAFTFDPADANGGVEVSTGIANGTAGRAKQTDLVTGTLTLHSNTTATVASGSGWTTGMVIGAVNADDSNAIQPGTTISNVSGTTITLSQAALSTGTALYAAACTWTLI